MQWKSAYTTYEEKLAQRNVEGHLVLRIKHFYSSFALATCRDTEEVLTDRFVDDFADTMDFVERYLTVAERRLSEKQHSFTGSQSHRSLFFGFSILPTLDLIAHKCRDPQLRRRALELLCNARKREGLEYSETLGYYAKAAAEIEEHRGVFLARDITILDKTLLQSVLPEQARFSDVVTIGEGALGVFNLICARYVHDGSEPKQIELAEYEGGAVPLRLRSSWRVAI
jgi:hypothetical protein